MERLNQSRLVAIAMILLAAAPVTASAVTTQRQDYPGRVEAGGKTLNLVGSGLREKWFFDVYTMAAYSESGSCDAEDLISADRIKLIQIDLRRDVSSDEMAEALGRAFKKNMPSDPSPLLVEQIRTFLSYFTPDLNKGDRIELTYVPGEGTVLKMNGTEQGTVIPGKAFAEVLWSCYFSSRTCCPGLQARILSQCAKRAGPPS